MNQRRALHLGFERAMYLTLSWALVLLVGIYTVAFPTSDLRARVHWLLGVVPVIVPVFFVLGTGAVALTGAQLRTSLGGIAAGAVLGYLVVATGVLNRLLPAAPDTPPRPWLVALSAALASLILWREWVHVRAGDHRDHQRAV